MQSSKDDLEFIIHLKHEITQYIAKIEHLKTMLSK